jgi:hypothetical protein
MGDINTLERCIVGDDTFITLCRQGEATLADLDTLLSQYKKKKTDKPLRNVIGLSQEQYISYVLKGSTYLMGLLDRAS